MARDFWNQIKHFKKEEFYSPDCECDKIDKTLVYALDYVRQQMEKPLIVNSGYRTVAHNKEVGGKPHSQHLEGKAADIHIDNQEMGDFIEYWFIDYLDKDVGIGRYNTFIHLDVGHLTGAKPGRRWDYRTK